MRNQARQKLERWCRIGTRRLRKRGRDLENHIQGTVAEMREAWSGHEHFVDANTLVDQVHSAIGRGFAATLEHINLNAVDHTIYLHGYVREAGDRERLLAAIVAVEGVEDVQAAELRVKPETPSQPEAVPEPGVRETSAPEAAARPRRRAHPPAEPQG